MWSSLGSGASAHDRRLLPLRPTLERVAHAEQARRDHRARAAAPELVDRPLPRLGRLGPSVPSAASGPRARRPGRARRAAGSASSSTRSTLGPPGAVASPRWRTPRVTGRGRRSASWSSPRSSALVFVTPRAPTAIRRRRWQRHRSATAVRRPPPAPRTGHHRGRRRRRSRPPPRPRRTTTATDAIPARSPRPTSTRPRPARPSPPACTGLWEAIAQDRPELGDAVLLPEERVPPGEGDRAIPPPTTRTA